MASIGNIAGLHLQAGANIASSQGVSAGAGGLMAFLNMMLGQAQGMGGQDLTANIAAALKNDPNNATSLTALLQKIYPNASADQLQQAVTQLEAGAPNAATIKPTLTSDLSAPFAAGMQQEDPAIMSQLQQKFDDLVKGGPVTADKIAQFRKDAVSFLKDKGLDNNSINRYLLSLSTDLGDKLPVAMAAQLAMPLPVQNAASAGANDADVTASVAAAGKSPVKTATTNAATQASSAAGADADDAGDAADASSEDATARAGHDTTSALLKPAAAAPQPLKADSQAQGLQQNNQPQGLNGGNDAAKNLPLHAAPAQANNAAPAAKPLPAAALHVFAMNNAQDGNSDASSGGQDGFQQAVGQNSLTAAQNAAAPGAPNFVNYMTNATGAANTQAAPTVQNVALQIQQNATNGVTTFTMQLEPAELGRLEVRLKFDRDGGIKAHLIADKPETLSMLRQDSSQIQRLLHQSGLHADENSLSFDLRQQGQQQNSDQSSYGGNRQANAYNVNTSASADIIQANIAIQAMGSIRQGGVNIMV